jgi:subtilase family serine protease
MKTVGIIVAIIAISPAALDTSDLDKAVTINHIIITKDTTKQTSSAFRKATNAACGVATYYHCYGLFIGSTSSAGTSSICISCSGTHHCSTGLECYETTQCRY